MTLDEIKAEIRVNLGARTDLDSFLTTYINRAQLKLAKRHAFIDLQREQTGTLSAYDSDAKTGGTYTYPTRWHYFNLLLVIDGSASQEIQYKPPAEFNARYPYPHAAGIGKPLFYTDRNDYFELAPYPDSDYTIWASFQMTPTVLSTGGSSPDIHNADEAIIAFAMVESYKALQMEAERRYWEAIAERELRTAILSERRRPNWKRTFRGFRSARTTLPKDPSTYPWDYFKG